jgi:hypothetical protein
MPNTVIGKCKDPPPVSLGSGDHRFDTLVKNLQDAAADGSSSIATDPLPVPPSSSSDPSGDISTTTTTITAPTCVLPTPRSGVDPCVKKSGDHLKIWRKRS